MGEICDKACEASKHNGVFDDSQQELADVDFAAAVTLHGEHGKHVEQRNRQRDGERHERQVIVAQQRRRNAEAKDGVVGAEHAENQNPAPAVVFANARNDDA